MSEYYNSIQNVERAILLEDIILPKPKKFPTLDEIESGKVSYRSLPELYTDTMGKFSIPIVTPLSDNTADANDVAKIKTSVKNILNNNCNIKLIKYQDSNYLELNIPRHILLNFLNKVPKGTVFLVAFIGGSIDAGDIKIIGVSEYA